MYYSDLLGKLVLFLRFKINKKIYDDENKVYLPSIFCNEFTDLL